MSRPILLTEHDLQVSILAECALRANQNPLYELIFAIPNGGHRNKATAGRLKAEGVKAGVPDLFLPVPSRGYHGLFIELKVGANKPTVAQKVWLGNLAQLGYCVAEVHDFANEAMRIITWYLDTDTEKGSEP